MKAIGADRLVSATAKALEEVAPQTTLTDGIAQAYLEDQTRFTAAMR